jgi:hypothetical protein
MCPSCRSLLALKLNHVLNILFGQTPRNLGQGRSFHLANRKIVLGREQCSGLHSRLRSSSCSHHPSAPLLRTQGHRPNHKPPMLAQQGKTDEHESSVALVSEPRHLSRSAHADSTCTSKTTSVTTLVIRSSAFWLTAPRCRASAAARREGREREVKNAPTHGLDLKFGKEGRACLLAGRRAHRYSELRCHEQSFSISSWASNRQLKTIGRPEATSTALKRSRSNHTLRERPPPDKAH